MPLGITQGISNWISQDNSVERFTDNAAYTSAHPDDTLLLMGPPRLSDVVDATKTAGPGSILAVGMLQTFQVASQKPTTPVMAIGSGRSFYVSGKSQTSWRIGRLFCNGRNLLRVLYHNAVTNGVQVQNFDDKAAGAATDNFFINLDSELFYIPFGMGAFFKDKMHDIIGGFYAELAMLTTYSLTFSVGQNMIMEDVGGLCDRLLPWRPTSVINSKSGADRKTIDTILGFTSQNAGSTALPTGAQGDFTALTDN